MYNKPKTKEIDVTDIYYSKDKFKDLTKEAKNIYFDILDTDKGKDRIIMTVVC